MRRLRDSQPVGLPQSTIPKGCVGLVEELMVCRAIEFQKANGGRGTVLRICSETAFSNFVGARLPRGLDVDLAHIPDRATAVAMLADAKAIHSSIGEGLFVRSTKPNVEIQSIEESICIAVGKLTKQAGGIGIQLSPGRSWTFSGHIAVIENSDAFWRHDLVLPQVDLAIFGSGNVSSRLLQWLASPGMAQCRVTHWGDYDPVGVNQYLRIADACPKRVDTYAPEIIDELLPKYGKRNLITGQTQFLDRLRSRTADPHVRRMLELFDRYHRGLEQEALLNDNLSVSR